MRLWNREKLVVSNRHKTGWERCDVVLGRYPRSREQKEWGGEAGVSASGPCWTLQNTASLSAGAGVGKSTPMATFRKERERLGVQMWDVLYAERNTKRALGTFSRALFFSFFFPWGIGGEWEAGKEEGKGEFLGNHNLVIFFPTHLAYSASVRVRYHGRDTWRGHARSLYWQGQPHQKFCSRKMWADNFHVGERWMMLLVIERKKRGGGSATMPYSPLSSCIRRKCVNVSKVKEWANGNEGYSKIKQQR